MPPAEQFTCEPDKVIPVNNDLPTNAPNAQYCANLSAGASHCETCPLKRRSRAAQVIQVFFKLLPS